MRVDLEATKRAIEERAASYYPVFKGTEMELRQLPFRENSTYPIYLFEMRAREADFPVCKIVVKFAPVFPENNEGQTEYENMLRFHHSSNPNDPELGYVRPLDFIFETNALVSEYVDAERFAPWFMRACCFGASPATRRDLRERVRRAGSWLAAMHARTAGETLRLGDSSFDETTKRVLAGLGEAGLLSRQLSRVNAFLGKIAPRVANLPAPYALIHGDYGPQNMAFARKRVYVFDLQRNFNEVIFHDLAFFLVTLKTVIPYPRYPRFSRRCALSLEQPFLQGYFAQELDGQQQLTLHLFYLRNLLERALKQYLKTSAGPFGPGLTRIALNAIYPRLLRREMEKINRLSDFLKSP